MNNRLTHAGAVAFREGHAGMVFLIVSSSNGDHWVLPKGHIEPGETPEETATRELREEAGVVGSIVKPLTVQQFTKDNEVVRVQYFLVRVTRVTTAMEQRQLRWEFADAATTLLSFPDAREALRLASSGE